MAGRALLSSTNIFSKLFKSPACRGVTATFGRHVNSKTLTSNASSVCAVQVDRSTTPSWSHSSYTTPSSLRCITSPYQPLFNLSSSSGSGILGNHSLPVEQRRFYQAALRPRLICSGCYFVWRHGRKHVECSDHPRHKQMKRVAKRKMWKEDYSKGDWIRALDFDKAHYRQAERNTDRTTLSHTWLAGKLGTEL